MQHKFISNKHDFFSNISFMRMPNFLDYVTKKNEWNQIYRVLLNRSIFFRIHEIKDIFLKI